MRSLCRWAAVLLVCVTGNALAQSYDNPGLGQQPVISQPADYKPLGVRAGSFMLHPGVELAAQYLDNVFYTSIDEQADWIWHVRPYITAQSTWSRHSFNIRVAADIARYDKRTILDYEDYFLQLGGTVDVMAQSFFSYGLDYMQLHEDRSSRSDEQGIEPTVYTLTGGFLGYDHTFNRFSIGLLYDVRMLDYDNSMRLDGEVIDNADRDRNEQALSARFGYQFKADKQAYLTVGWNETSYDQEPDRNGFYRDSDGYWVDGGIDFLITGVLSGNFGVGYHNRSYSDPALPDVDGWGLSAGLTWVPTLLTTVRANFVTSVEDTTQSTASGYMRYLYSIRADHELLRNLQISAMLSYYQNDYQLIADAPPEARSEDDMWVAELGGTFYFNRWSWLSASYKYQDYSSDVPFDTFEANTVWLVLGFER